MKNIKKTMVDITELLQARKVLTDKITNLSFSYQFIDKYLAEINKQIDCIDKLILALLEKKENK